MIMKTSEIHFHGARGARPRGHFAFSDSVRHPIRRSGDGTRETRADGDAGRARAPRRECRSRRPRAARINSLLCWISFATRDGAQLRSQRGLRFEKIIV